MTPPPQDRLSQPIPREVRDTLSFLERLHFELALRMNREPIKALWTQVQRRFGAIAIRFLTRRLVHDHGFEHVQEAFRRGSILFVANHRTYFDLFVVSSLLHRRLEGRRRLYFPVVGQYYYQSVVGILLNQFAASWSMFPPLFALPTHGVSDRYALDLLCDLCARGPGTILGIHPEGGRNLDPDPYSLMRCQPGAGRIIHAARPIVIPVFIAGLNTNIGEQVRANFVGGDRVRVWFGEPVDLDALLALPGKGSTYKGIVDAVMDRVRQLGDEDRALYT